jgi:hypothetical protein
MGVGIDLYDDRPVGAFEDVHAAEVRLQGLRRGHRELRFLAGGLVRVHGPPEGRVGAELPRLRLPAHGRDGLAAHDLDPQVLPSAFDVLLEDHRAVPGDQSLELGHVVGQANLLAEGSEAVLDHHREPQGADRVHEESPVGVPHALEGLRAWYRPQAGDPRPGQGQVRPRLVVAVHDALR